MSEIAREVDSTLVFLIAFCTVILVGVAVAMFAMVFKYHRSKSPTTKQIHSHTGLEVAWTVVPFILCIGLFFVGYEGFKAMRTPPADAMQITVTAQRWFWSFTYPDSGITTGELTIPVNRSVKLNIRTDDNEVLHSLYIPAFRVKEDAVPGLDTYIWLHPDQTGTFNIFCAEFCGKDHSKMITTLHVVEQDEYDAWLDKQVAEYYRPVEATLAMSDDPEVLAGYDGDKLFTKYCASCHGAGGEGGGPYKARDFRSLEGWKQGTKKTDVFKTISTGIPGTEMRSFAHLPVRERLALMRKITSFHPDRQQQTVEDIAVLKAAFPELDPTRAVQIPKPNMPIDEAMKQVVEEGQVP